MADPNIRYLSELQEYENEARSISNENTRRLHTLLITISGFGIYIFFEIWKFNLDPQNSQNEWGFIDKILLPICAVAFLSSILCSFHSLYLSKRVHENQAEYIEEEIKLVKEAIQNRSEVKKNCVEDLAEKLNKSIKNYNSASLWFMKTGILFLVLFVVKEFIFG